MRPEFEAEFQAHRDARRARTAQLLGNLKGDHDALVDLMVWCRDRPERFDSFAMYRFYHQSPQSVLRTRRHDPHRRRVATRIA